ncbi:MAG: 4-hydroxybenzoate polyprenyltransferase [Chlamydiales bacterium]
MRTYGRMMRLSLAPSALADISAGILVGAHGHWPTGTRAPWILMLASLCIVHGAMILNDWSDRGGDSVTRPDRPIPSGAISATRALRLGGVLLLLGPLLAYVVAPPLLLPAAGLSLLALLYDLGLRGPFQGPLLLALCRAGNLYLGWMAGCRLSGAPLETAAILPALFYFGYVFFVARLGRLEDDEDPRPLGRRPSAYIGGAAICLALGPLSLIPRFGFSLGFFGAMLLSIGGAFVLMRESVSKADWDRARVGRNMGRALRRLLIFSAALSFATLERSLASPDGAWDGLWVGLAILGGYPVSFALRRVFPPS